MGLDVNAAPAVRYARAFLTFLQMQLVRCVEDKGYAALEQRLRRAHESSMSPEGSPHTASTFLVVALEGTWKEVGADTELLAVLERSLQLFYPYDHFRGNLATSQAQLHGMSLGTNPLLHLVQFSLSSLRGAPFAFAFGGNVGASSLGGFVASILRKADALERPDKSAEAESIWLPGGADEDTVEAEELDLLSDERTSVEFLLGGLSTEKKAPGARRRNKETEKRLRRREMELCELEAMLALAAAQVERLLLRCCSGYGATEARPLSEAKGATAPQDVLSSDDESDPVVGRLASAPRPTLRDALQVLAGIAESGFCDLYDRLSRLRATMLLGIAPDLAAAQGYGEALAGSAEERQQSKARLALSWISFLNTAIRAAKGAMGVVPAEFSSVAPGRLSSLTVRLEGERNKLTFAGAVAAVGGDGTMMLRTLTTLHDRL
jgi:hypothetical protein